MNAINPETAAEYLESRVEIQESGCLEWRGKPNDHKGYGRARIAGRRYLAHRLAFFAARGFFPEPPLVVRHSCDNPLCCNPQHLSVGTQIDNIQDRTDRRRTAVGSGNGKAKLTPDDVRFIRAHPQRGHQNLADELGVTATAVRSVRIGRTWRHLEMENTNG